MRPLVLTADYAPLTWSGIGTAVATQARALDRLDGVGVRVLFAGDDARVPEDAFVHRLSPRRCPVRPAEFDLIHLHSLALAELAFQMRRRFGLPLVYTAHSLLHRELAGHPGAAGWVRVQTAVLRGSDHVVFLSRQERAEALARLPELAGRCSVVPNGLRPPALPAVPRSPHDGPIVFAGRFTRAKGIVLFAEIVRRLAGTDGYRFVLAGGHADVAGQAVATQLRERYPDACQVVGWVRRQAVDALLARARLVLVPSRYEPFGMTALEAMAMGVPVLAAAVGGLPDLVTAESGGQLVDSSDPAVWCRSIVDLLCSPQRYRELSRRGPRHVTRHHDAVRLAARLVDDVYRPLLAGAGPAVEPAAAGLAHAAGAGLAPAAGGIDVHR
jgi:glycosyltransferase involved in cell wall biosynthesis